MQTSEGARKSQATLRAKLGEGYSLHFQTIGAKGGKVSRGGGFTGDPERARVLGAKGGAASRRRPQTQCKRGHDLTPENVYNYGRGRQCKQCRAITTAIRRAKLATPIPTQAKPQPMPITTTPHATAVEDWLKPEKPVDGITGTTALREPTKRPWWRWF